MYLFLTWKETIIGTRKKRYVMASPETLPLLITLHNNIHYPPFPLGALRSGWMIPNAWAKMKQQKSFNSSQNFIKNDFEIEKSCHKLQK